MQKNEEALENITEVRRLQLKPDDIIILKSDGFLNKDQAELLRQKFTECLGVSNKVMVLVKGLDIEVLEKTEGDTNASN